MSLAVFDIYKSVVFIPVHDEQLFRIHFHLVIFKFFTGEEKLYDASVSYPLK